MYYTGMKYCTTTSKPWQYYISSSKELVDRIGDFPGDYLDNYEFHFLVACANRSQTRMAEMHLQFQLDVIHDPLCYNRHIGGMMWAGASKLSQETRKKISESMGGATIIATHQVTGIQREFEGATQLELSGFDKAHVSKCINGIRKTHGGYTWAWKDVLC